MWGWTVRLPRIFCEICNIIFYNKFGNKSLDFIIVQRGTVTGDIEKAACENILSTMNKKLPIKLFLTDRHTGIRALMKNKFPHVNNEFYVWHLAKSLMKMFNKNPKSSVLHD